MTVDGYTHCGVDRFLPVGDLDVVMTAADVSGAVLCQHLGAFDNSYIASLIEVRPDRFAGVALVDHASENWPEELAKVGSQGFRGVRVTTAALAENELLARAAAEAGLIVLIYAPDGIAGAVPALLGLAADNPQASFVVSHLGNPVMTAAGAESGEALIRLAALPNVFVLLSGLSMFCPSPYDRLDGFIENVIRAFGTSRVMWGSNFPVGGDEPADYRRELELILAADRWGIDSKGAMALTDTTARRVWFQ